MEREVILGLDYKGDYVVLNFLGDYDTVSPRKAKKRPIIGITTCDGRIVSLKEGYSLSDMLEMVHRALGVSVIRPLQEIDGKIGVYVKEYRVPYLDCLDLITKKTKLDLSEYDVTNESISVLFKKPLKAIKVKYI